MNEEKFKRWLTGASRDSQPRGFDSPDHYAAGIWNINNRLALNGEGLFDNTKTLDELEELLKNPILTTTNRNIFVHSSSLRNTSFRKKNKTNRLPLAGQ